MTGSGVSDPQFVTQTVEVESPDSQKALAEVRMKNAALQEQLSVQRQLLRELETQLHESQRTCAQLRTQVTPPVGRSARPLPVPVPKDRTAWVQVPQVHDECPARRESRF